MKKILVNLFIVIFFFLFYSCEDHLDDLNEPPNSQSDQLSDSYFKNSTAESEYDLFANRFSLALSKTLKNKDIRLALKNRAMQKIDGDYDIIWKDFNKNEISGKTLLNHIESHFNLPSSVEERITCIRDFGNRYKRFQISVPINCENWDAENFIPLVTYIPSDFDESWKSIEAYDSDGNIHILSLLEKPKEPVVVVSINERSDKDGNILAFYKKRVLPILTIPAPTNLTASSSICYQVDLSWSYSSVDPLIGFHIYRKVYGTSSFSYLTSVPGYARNYFDSNINENKTYYYYLVAYNSSEESLSSNQTYTTVPSCTTPTDPANLIITYINSSQVTLNWDNVTNESGFSVWERVRYNGYLSYWNQIATTGVNQTEFEKSSIHPEKEYYYKVYAFNDQATSAPSNQVIVYGSGRSINAHEVASSCYFNTWDGLRRIESWLSGAPEMALKIVSSNSTTGDAIQLAGGPHTFEPIKDNHIVWPNVYNWNHEIFQWDVRTHPVVVNWFWYEVDPNDSEMSITVGITAEIPPKTGVKMSASVSVKMTANDDHICTQPVNWHDEFPKTFDMGEFVFTIDHN